MKIIKYLLPLFFLYLIASCDDDICTSETNSILNAEIVVVDSILIQENFDDSLFVFSPEWSDSIKYWEQKKNYNYLFTLSPNDTITTIIIGSRDHSSKDTVKFIHKNELVLLSPECGFVIHYNIDSLVYTSNLIDSVFLINDDLTIEKNGHVQIYL